MSIELGNLDGEKCNRGGCEGIICHTREGSCSCHNNPPCSYCTDDGQYCPECEWSNADDNRESRRKELANPKPIINFDFEAARQKRIELNKGKLFEIRKYFDDHFEGVIAKDLDYESADNLLDKCKKLPACYVSYQMNEQ